MTRRPTGRTPASGAFSAASLTERSAKKRWWLTMMMSLSAALRRISVMKQRSNSVHLLPMQCSALALSLPQSGAGLGQGGELGAVAGLGFLVPVERGCETR